MIVEKIIDLFNMKENKIYEKRVRKTKTFKFQTLEHRPLCACADTDPIELKFEA